MSYKATNYRAEHPEGKCTELESKLAMNCSLNRTKVRKLKERIITHRNASNNQDTRICCDYILWNIDEIGL